MRAFALATIILLSVTAPAAATIQSNPVKLRLAGERPVLRPGEPATVSFELLSTRDAEIGALEITSKQVLQSSANLTAPRVLRRDQPLQFDVQLLTSESPEPVIIRYLVDGEPVEKSIDLTLLLEESTEGVRLEKVSDESRRPLPHSASELEVMRSPLPGDSAGGEAATHERSIRVRGRFVYYNSDGNNPRGVDGMRVRVKDRDQIPGGLVVLAQGFTDVDGWFDLLAAWGPDFLNGDLEPDIYVEFESESDYVRVQTATLELEYSFRTPTTWDYEGSDFDIGTFAPPLQTDAGALFIFNSMQRNRRYYQTRRGHSVPEVHVQWPDDSSLAHYDPFWEEIHLNSGNTWNDMALAHEYAHHFLYNFSSAPDNDYCNGNCDPDGCSHCLWCEETGGVAVNEGWAEFMSYVMIESFREDYGFVGYNPASQEDVEECTIGGSAVLASPWITEGLFAALLQDIWDDDNEDDPLDTTSWGIDQLSLGHDPIFDIIEQDRPQTPAEFIDDFHARYPQYRLAFWQTAANSTYQLDADPPGPVVNLHSTTHSTAESSPKSQILMDWDPASDDWSGIGEHDFVIDRPGALPDTSFVLTESTVAFTYPLPPGTYYISVRARDLSGKSGPWSTAGPFVLIQPDPVDLVFLQPAGWPKPIIPNSSASATPSSVPYPQFLQGNLNSTYLNYAFSNTGDLPGLGAAQSWLLLDGVHLPGFFNASPLPGQVVTAVNVGPYTVRGGRHYIGGYLDELWQWSELDETNNTWGGPWVWSKQTISWGSRMTRSAPPGATDGWWYVRDPIPLYYSCDGLGIWATTGWWHVLWIAADDDTADYDLRVYNGSSSNVDLGYDVVQGSSLRGPGCLDLMVVNRHNTAIPGWDAGITNSNGGTSTYEVGSFYNEALTIGTAYDATLWANAYVRLFELEFVAGTKYTIRATGDPADGPFRAAIIDQGFVRGGLSDGSISSVDSDEQGRITFNIQPAASGKYAFMVYRDPKYGRGARQILLEAKLAMPDMLPLAATGWDAPLLPSTAPVPPTELAVSTPVSLDGNAASTYLNAYVGNVGWGTSPANMSLDFELDGVNVRSILSSAISPLTGITILEQTPITVTGGRHTLAIRIDSAGAYDDLQESNNWWGEQWVWSPLQLAEELPVSRPAPPSKTGGWSEVTNDSTRYYNCDGLRTPLFANQPAQWAGVAVSPGAGAALDLAFHEPSTGVRDGFAGGLGAASGAEGESNYLLVDFAQTPRRVLDLGVVNANDSSVGYSAEAVPAALATPSPTGVIGPLSLPAGRTLMLSEVQLTAGSYLVRLVPGSGASANLGLAIHGAAPAVQSEVDALGAAWSAPAGQIEECIFSAPADASYCFAVWRVVADGAVDATQYTLEIGQSVVSTGDEALLPTRTRLQVAGPNPFQGQTQFAFDLARAGNVTLEIFNLRGARVRTLAGGQRTAGSYRVAWDGRDGHGRQLATGVYLARLVADGRSWSTKVVLLE